ncbi:MAG TPA: chemotaxis-specific protein-glutamate methyltransferase CheB [Kofleriaceae bacterium]|jgi:two-component system chemotaxis response regulator CheB
MIRVLVVDDSLTVRRTLCEILARDPEIEVVGEAADGRRALELVAKLRPDVITLDIVMPDMTGLAVTEEVMANHPTPILVVSSSFNRGELFHTYSALSAGAVDVLDKPHLEDLDWERRFLAAVRMVAKIRVITHVRGRLGLLGRGPVVVAPARRPPTAEPDHAEARAPKLVALGASTGGPGALATVLAGIAPRFPLPILVVLHIDARFAVAFAEWLATQTNHDVRLASDGELVVGGRVLIAPPDTHLTIVRGHVRLDGSPARNYCRPSIDVLFESLATEYGPNVAACVLTGMGRDGAAGLLAIRNAGGMTIAQDEATSIIYGMPREAVARGAVERELPLGEIGPALDGLRNGGTA